MVTPVGPVTNDHIPIARITEYSLTAKAINSIALFTSESLFMRYQLTLNNSLIIYVVFRLLKSRWAANKISLATKDSSRMTAPEVWQLSESLDSMTYSMEKRNSDPTDSVSQKTPTNPSQFAALVATATIAAMLGKPHRRPMKPRGTTHLVLTKQT